MESPGEYLAILSVRLRVRFNSLQTGKFMERLLSSTTTPVQTSGFQFPSNGKVHGKNIIENGVNGITNEGFNSLQTGKFMESTTPPHRHGMTPRFNSLQTGKFMERDNTAMTSRQINVSIPFKRESSWKVYRTWWH